MTKDNSSLDSAISKFHSLVKVIPFDKQGFNYQYSSLNAIALAIREPLIECGLSYKHILSAPPQGFDVCVNTVLTHIPTKESVTSTMPMVSPKKDAQGFGSVTTYAKRYTLSALLGLITDEDDDGASNKETNKKMIHGEEFEETEQGWQRTAEAKAKYESVAQEFKAQRNSAGLSVKDVQALFGVKLTNGLALCEIESLIDLVIDYRERREKNQLTDDEVKRLGE